MSKSFYEQFAPLLIFLIIAFGLVSAFAIIGIV
ncbi:NADH-quinone oxidoreductase subunit A, partial [Francisella tularensis subsp. holarctica]|nr:NADH-quinone oxidoreductase subunit A [Francisella tularensis subsp. holarctica]